MTATAVSTTTSAATATAVAGLANRPAAVTRTLLTCGAVGFPVWSLVSLTQAATRGGFDLLRHPLSALSTGPLGWIQIANFLLAGVLTVLGATGLRRAVPENPGAGRLMGVAGVATIAAGCLVMDAPPGFNAPADLVVTSMTGHSIGHMVSGTVMFFALTAACFVVGRRLSRAGRRGLAVVSRTAGVALAVGDAWACSGGTAGSLTIAIGGIVAMVWMAGVCAVLAHRV